MSYNHIIFSIRIAKEDFKNKRISKKQYINVLNKLENDFEKTDLKYIGFDMKKFIDQL